MLLVVLAVLLVPSAHVGAIGFRVLFQGATDGHYPNGTRFAGADVVATPVLSAVYEAQSLQQYLPFDRFKNAMFVLQANRQLELLSYEYGAKLSDTKLPPVERARLEDEFKRKRESLSSADYSLNFNRVERIRRIPPSVVAQTIKAVLDEWARQAREQKRALQYDIPVYSRNILQPDLVAREDYIIAVDVLRTKVNKILTNIAQVSELPGSAVVRSPKTHLSLAEITLNLQDLLRFDIEPSITLITSEKLTRDPQRSRVYVQDQLRQIMLSHEASAQRVKAIQDPLREYVTMSAANRAGATPGTAVREDGTGPLNTSALIPQLGESFLQQVIDMSTQNNDAKYRQALTDRVIDEGLHVASDDRERIYYTDLSHALGAWTKSADTQDSKDLVARLSRAYETVAASLDDVSAIYEQLSLKNLNPSTQLYEITTPFSQRTERTISFFRMLAFAALLFVVLAAALIVGCLVHYQFRSRPVEAAAAEAAKDLQRV